MASKLVRGAAASFLVAVAVVGVTATPAHAATFELIDAEPSDTITTVNGDVIVTSTLGPQAEFNVAYAGTGYFATNASNIELSYVDWTFSQPVYQVTVYYFAVESATSGGGADPHQFSTNRGPVNLALVADGGNRIASTGLLNGSTQPEATLSGDTASCEITVDPNACSGTMELSFPEGITSFRSFNGGTPNAGFNGTGLAIATDVPDPVSEPQPEVDGEALADTGIATNAVWLGIAAAAAMALGALGLLRVRKSQKA